MSYRDIVIGILPFAVSFLRGLSCTFSISPQRQVESDVIFFPVASKHFQNVGIATAACVTDCTQLWKDRVRMKALNPSLSQMGQ